MNLPEEITDALCAAYEAREHRSDCEDPDQTDIATLRGRKETDDLGVIRCPSSQSPPQYFSRALQCCHSRHLRVRLPRENHTTSPEISAEPSETTLTNSTRHGTLVSAACLYVHLGRQQVEYVSTLKSNPEIPPVAPTTWRDHHMRLLWL